MRTIITFLAYSLFFISCTSINKLVEKGRYDDAYDYAINKLAGKKKKTEYVKALERAYAELNSRDLRHIEELSIGNSTYRWEKMLEVYKKMEHRQDRIIPLLPLVSNDGYTAKIELVNYIALKADCRYKATDLFYTAALTKLEEAKLRKSKLAARDAYYWFSKVAEYNSGFKDTRTLTHEAEELGTIHIAIDFKNVGESIYHDVFESNIRKLNVNAMNTHWEKYYLIDKAKYYDKYIVINTGIVDFGKEREVINHYEVTKTIAEGKVPMRTRSGHELKDSTGKVILIDKMVDVHAHVTEITRHTESIAEASIMIYDEVKSRPSAVIPIKATHIFDDSAVRYEGDRRALDGNICNRLDSYIANFPSDYDTSHLLTNELVRSVERAIKDLDIYVM